MLARHPKPVVDALRTIASASPGCVVFHCAGGKDRTVLLALVLLALAGATEEESIADYLLSYERMEHRYAKIGAGDQLAKVRKVVADRDTTIEESLSSTIGSLSAPGFLLTNGFSKEELGRLGNRLTSDRQSN